MAERESDLTEAIDRHCKKRKCKTFLPGEPETVKIEDKDDLVRLGPCPECGGWNILDGNDKTISVTEEYFEVYEKGLQRVMELDRLRSGLPDTTQALISETVDFLTATYRNAYEAGRRIIVLKEDTRHGDFLDNLESIGIAERTARRLMHYARVAANRPTSAVLGPDKVDLLTAGGADWDEAEETGDILGRPIEDWERMSVREMRAEIKKLRGMARKGADLQDQLMAEKEALEARVKELEQATLKTPSEKEQEAGQFLDNAALSFAAIAGGFHSHQWGDYSEWTQKKFKECFEDIGRTYAPLMRQYYEEYPDLFEVIKD